MPENGGGGSIIGAIVDGLLRLFGIIRNNLAKVVQAILSSLSAIASFIALLARYSVVALTSAVRVLGTLFRTLIVDGVGKFIPKVIQTIQQLKAALANILGPVLKFLNELQQRFDIFFDRNVRPILEVISRVRRALSTLRIFHIKFVTKLDRYLATLENRIYTAFFEVRSYLVTASNYLNLVVDPFGLLQIGTFMLSVLRSLPDIFNALHRGRGRELSTGELLKLADTGIRFDGMDVSQAASTLRKGGTLPEMSRRQDAIKTKSAGIRRNGRLFD